MQQVAQPWLVLTLSGSAFWVGMTGFATNLPGLLFTLPGGFLADHFDRKKVTVFFQVVQFVFVFAMVVLLVMGWLRVWMIVVISFMVGLTDALCNPSLQTIVPSLVVRKDIPRAVSLNSTQYNLSRIMGPAIAGIVIARFGAVACFSANAISYLPYLVSIWFLYPNKKVAVRTKHLQYDRAENIQEIRMLLRSGSVRFPLVTVFVANFFCGPLVTFCAVLIRDQFQSGVGDFGTAMTAFGGGALMGSAVSFIALPVWFGRNKLSAILAVLQGVLMMGIAVTHDFSLVCVLLVFSGASQIAVNILINTYLQEKADDDKRGRVASLYQLAMSSGVAIGAFLTGLIVSKYSITSAFLLNGALAVGFQFWLLVWQMRSRRSGGVWRIFKKK